MKKIIWLKVNQDLSKNVRMPLLSCKWRKSVCIKGNYRQLAPSTQKIYSMSEKNDGDILRNKFTHGYYAYMKETINFTLDWSPLQSLSILFGEFPDSLTNPRIS